MPRKIEGRHVLYMLLGFFGVMFAVNGVFVYLALTSFSGISVLDAYKRGLNYNAELSSAEEQLARGWKSNLVVEDLGGKKIVLTLQVTDNNDELVKGVEAAIALRRPINSDSDMKLMMVPTRSGFETEIALPHPGQWDLSVLISGGGYDAPYRLERRLWVK